MQAVAAIHGFDALGGAEGPCGLLLGPPGFEGRPPGQPPGLDLAASGFRVVGIRRLGGCLVGAELGQRHDEPRAGERSGELGLCEGPCS